MSDLLSPLAPLRVDSPLRDELKALFRLATPLGLAQAGQALMGLVDTAVVGRLSDVAQGAVGLGNGLFFAFATVGIGVMLAFDPLISQAVGAGHLARARTLYWQSCWMAVIAGVVLAGPLWLSPLLLEPFGVDPAVAQGAAEYVAWRVPQLMGFLLFMGARSYLQSNGRATAIVVSMLLANLANLGLDILLVFGAGPIPPLGIAGASIATTVCSWLQLGVLALVLGRAPEGSSRKLDLAVIKQALALGIPIGLQMLAEVGVFVLAGIFAGRLGRTSVAAHQIAITWASFSFCFSVGIGSAAATRVGWAIGAGEAAAARRSGLVAIAAGTAWMTASALVFLLVPRL
ncbi:MAG: efflux family protein, partial [Myxococcaceae bacterium]|nr:efflux family protein [Myxococcaceae bacterium]